MPGCGPRPVVELVCRRCAVTLIWETSGSMSRPVVNQGPYGPPLGPEMFTFFAVLHRWLSHPASECRSGIEFHAGLRRGRRPGPEHAQYRPRVGTFHNDRLRTVGVGRSRTVPSRVSASSYVHTPPPPKRKSYTHLPKFQVDPPPTAVVTLPLESPPPGSGPT